NQAQKGIKLNYLGKESILQNDKIKVLIQEKSDAYGNWLTSRIRQDREIYKQNNSELRRTVKEEKCRTWEMKCAEIEITTGGACSTGA
ncbi:hypothetical protein HHI36_017310, partial [Cryptolaemus montrouzieri]